MLSHLYIRDYTIVQKLELAFESGFTVLTGETGAGKSILVDALALALGERADANVIRQGCQRAEIAASFDLNPTQDAARWLAAHDLFADGECLLRRVVERDRPSRGFINGRPSPMQMLREVGELLVDIHGQHEYQSLLRRDGQRQLLDDFSGLGESLASLGEHYQQLQTLTAQLQTLRQQSSERDARVELLRYQIRELEALAMNAEEIAALDEEQKRLANGAELLTGLQEIAAVLYDDERESVSGTLSRASSRLEQLSRYDARLGQLVELLNEAGIRIDEAAGQLHNYLHKLDLDPQRLQWVEQRVASIYDLTRKHKVRPEELPELLERLRREYSDLEDVDVSITRIEESLQAHRQAYNALAKQLSRKRKAGAQALERAVTSQLPDLGMPGGRFAVALEALDPGEVAATGLERVELLFSANPGQPLRPLSKVASGGELSRVSLALHVVAAQSARIPVLIFDEVDVGIGGRVAEVVGQQLRQLGRSRAVLCITHLAQVAALGDHHLLVSKITKDKETFAHVRRLSADERVNEIARMIGGIKISRQTLDHAQDMLARALHENRVPA